jgi:signal transduction histidine kinase/CheY-like chemotaxis protein
MPDDDDLGSIAEELRGDGLRDPAAEVQRQNQELLSALGELRARQVELERVNQELEDTNRGVLALYAELDEKAEGLKRLSDEKSRFLSHMSHEFRTPLSSIQALSQLLLDRTDGELTTEQERQVGYIRKAAVGLNDIVNDLLDIAKIEAGMVPVRPGRFTVPDMFSALRGMLRPLRSSPTVELVFEDASGLPPLFTDEAKVSQILRNLISNALKYTEQGEVRVSAQIAADETVTFRVADTGVGIAEEHQGAIFQEFSQVEGAARRPVKGTGLGLPLSRRLAVLLGGELGVRSALGEGATFWATIPVVYGARSAQEGERGKVLVIDRNRSSRDALRALLEERRLTVVEARSSAEGLRLAREERPQAIIIDLEMAGGSGLEVLDRLEADPQLREVPVIVNASRVLDGEERADLEHRVAAVLATPIAQADGLARETERLLTAILSSRGAALMEDSSAKQP